MTRVRIAVAGACVLLALGCGAEPDGREAVDDSRAPSAEVGELAKELESGGIRVSGGGEVPPSAAAPAPLAVSGEFSATLSSDVVARTTGRVEAVLAEVGDAVRKGQTLLRLESEYLRLELQRAEAELARAQAAFAEAESDFGRKQELLRRDSIPQAVHDRSEALYGQARAAVAAAEATAALARQRLADAEVRAPFSGVVAERRVDPGERLSEATVAYVVTQLQPLRLRFELPERYLAAIETGRELGARVDAYPDEIFAGRITRLSKVVSSETRAFLVEAEFANGDGRLRPGMFARVELPGVLAASPVTAAPSAAKEEGAPNA